MLQHIRISLRIISIRFQQEIQVLSNDGRHKGEAMFSDILAIAGQFVPSNIPGHSGFSQAGKAITSRKAIVFQLSKFAKGSIKPDKQLESILFLFPFLLYRSHG